MCKEIQTEEALPVRISLNVANHILELPKEILLKITFCLDGIPWGLEAARKKVKALIDFLEEKGFATEANDFKNGDTTLNLNNKNIKDEGAKVIGEGLKASTSLTVLNLQGNKITNEGVEAISNGLKINTSLTLLNLENNLIEKEGTKTIVEALETNTSLLSLDLNGNNIEVESKNIIQVYIERNKKISNEKTAKLEGSKLSSGVTTNIVKEIIYDNLLLNHSELLASSLRKFSLQKIGELSENLDHNLIQQAINNNDSELVLAGLTSLLGGAEIL